MKKENTNSEQDFPGYPHYPPQDDITNEGEKVEMGREEQPLYDEPAVTAAAEEEKTAATVTENDIRMLSAADQGRDLDDADPEEATLDSRDNEGDLLNEETGTYDEAGSDLDVPGSEQDDADEAIGEEDEENNYYSLGGDNHENLEEDTSV